MLHSTIAWYKDYIRLISISRIHNDTIIMIKLIYVLVIVNTLLCIIHELNFIVVIYLKNQIYTAWYSE